MEIVNQKKRREKQNRKRYVFSFFIFSFVCASWTVYWLQASPLVLLLSLNVSLLFDDPKNISTSQININKCHFYSEWANMKQIEIITNGGKNDFVIKLKDFAKNAFKWNSRAKNNCEVWKWRKRNYYQSICSRNSCAQGY